jgi:hypothetical protein
MLYKFLLENKTEILATAKSDSHAMAGVRPSSAQLDAGIPIFFNQLLNILKLKEINTTQVGDHFGREFLTLGYTLSHVIHIYCLLSQSITSFASQQNFEITSQEFHDLNRCLDVAIASAVTEFQSHRYRYEKEKEYQRCGFCAHELRNALGAANLSYQLIKSGAVGIAGNTGQILEKNLMLMEKLIGRSLTEVKLGRAETTRNLQQTHLLLLVDQILITASVEAKAKDQHFDLQITPTLVFEADPQFLHSALSN